MMVNVISPCGDVGRMVNELADTTMPFPSRQPLPLSQATTMEYSMIDAQQQFLLHQDQDSDEEGMSTDDVLGDGAFLGVGATPTLTRVVEKF